MNAMQCHHACCLNANNKEMQFSNEFGDKAKKAIFTKDLQSHYFQVNKEILDQATKKTIRKGPTNQLDFSIETQEIVEIMETKEFLTQKEKKRATKFVESTSSSGR